MKKPVRRRLPSVHAPTQKKKRTSKKMSTVEKLRQRLRNRIRKNTKTISDKKFDKKRSTITKQRRTKRKSSFKRQKPEKYETITTKAGRKLPVKYHHVVTIGKDKSIKIPFSRNPSSGNPIAHYHRWKKVHAHLTESMNLARTAAEKKKLSASISNAKMQMKRAGHKIPQFVANARKKNPSLIEKAAHRAALRKEKRVKK